MTTALDLIRPALESIGAYAAGEIPSGADSDLAFNRLNDLISSWRNEYINIYQVIPIIIPLINGTGTYTIGPTGSPNILQNLPDYVTLGPATALTTASLGTGTATFALLPGSTELVVNAVPAGVALGSLVVDLTNPSALPFGTVIANLQTLSLSSKVLSPGINAGDVIGFGSIPTGVVSVAAMESSTVIDPSTPPSSTPYAVYYEKQFPFGQFFVFPTPIVSGWLVVQGWYPFFNFASLNLPDMVLTPGEERAIIANLALDLKPYFSDTPPSPLIASLAVSTKQMLKYTNQTSRALIRRGMQP